MINPLTCKQPFTPFIHLLFGLLYLSLCYHLFSLNVSFTLTSLSPSFNMSKPPQNCCFPSFAQSSLKLTPSLDLFNFLYSSLHSACHFTHTPQHDIFATFNSIPYLIFQCLSFTTTLPCIPSYILCFFWSPLKHSYSCIYP